MVKTAVVTGGAGFIGSHLCERLISEGYKVFCIDNLITGSLENIENLFREENFVFIKQDVTNYLHIPEEVGAVFHFASPASPEDYLKYPIQTLKVGALGTHKTLGLALAKKALYVLASTSEVYGDPLVNPQPEEYWGNVNPIGPRGVYDEAKRFAEAMTMAYHRYHNLDIRIIRIFNTYGPRMRLEDGRVVPNFLCQALKGKNLTIYGDGKQTRSFCFIEDLIEGIMLSVQRGIPEPMNLGNPEEMSILEFAKIVKEFIPQAGDFIFKPLPQDDPQQRRPDISKAKRVLGWEPGVPVREGLLKTIPYFKKKLGIL